MYQTPAKLSEKIERIEETLLIARRTDAIFAQEKAAERVALVQTKAALAQEKAALAQTKAALVQTKAALAQEKSARDERLALKEKNVPEIKTLENLKLIPGLTFKDTPGFPVLTPDVFETSVDRDREFKAIYKFLLDREPLFGNSKKSDLRNVCICFSYAHATLTPVHWNSLTKSCVLWVPLVGLRDNSF